ncbi:MAG: DNA repair protein RecN [Calditrichia bacterium]
MLKNIHIRNFALAHHLDLEFQPGLNIVTGETGTGKSIIVGAISAVLGGRVFTEVVRTGEEKATVEAIFDISHLPRLKALLEEKGLNNGDELFLRREIYVKGTTRAFVNDTPVPVNTVAQIGDELVDIHGQNQHQSLLRRETQAYFLDAYGQLEPKVQTVAQAYAALQKSAEAVENLEKKQRQLEEKYELYQFQVNEIDAAHLTPGEDEQLEVERRILSNSEKLFSFSSEFQQIVSGDATPNLQQAMAQALIILRDLSEYSPEMKNLCEEFTSARIIVDEAARQVEEFQNKLEFNPTRLEEIEQRLANISQLKKKYGATIQDILNYRNSIEAELQLKENFEFELKKLKEIHEQRLEHYKTRALELSQIRKEVARRLEQEVIEQLHKIGMPKTRFRVNIDWIEETEGIIRHQGKTYRGDASGMDEIEFYISPNPGEDYKPLAKIASGGEISRIMLALKKILAEIDQIPLLIFDEIDSGVSGRIALAVGDSIFHLADSHQIICITHLPQIASFGDSHYRVIKHVKDGRTFTDIQVLSGEERIEEIARLMGGKKLTPAILESARQLIGEARSKPVKSKSM